MPDGGRPPKKRPAILRMTSEERRVWLNWPEGERPPLCTIGVGLMLNARIHNLTKETP